MRRIEMRVVYQSRCYRSENVTGRYVRVLESTPRYMFRVFEAETCKTKGSRHFNKHGFGGTIREYDTDGRELPEELKAICIKTKEVHKWDLTTTPQE